MLHPWLISAHRQCLTEVEAQPAGCRHVRAELQARDLDVAATGALRCGVPEASRCRVDCTALSCANGSRTQPSYALSGHCPCVAAGTAAEVIEALDASKAANNLSKPVAAVPVAATCCKTGCDRRRKSSHCTSSNPSRWMSLSAMPAGSSAAVDEAAAMREMSGMDCYPAGSGI